MIEITEKVIVNADRQKVWAFISDINQSLNFNRFHMGITVPNNFKLNSDSTFGIDHNFGFGNYHMKVSVTECIPLQSISFSEKNSEDPEKGFPHDTHFSLESLHDSTKIVYKIKGTYGGKVQDLSFTPILKGVAKEELLKIKNAIESAENLPKGVKPENATPV